MEMAAGTRGLILDIRNYPSEFVVFTLGNPTTGAVSVLRHFSRRDAHCRTKPGLIAMECRAHRLDEPFGDLFRLDRFQQRRSRRQSRSVGLGIPEKVCRRLHLEFVVPGSIA